MNDRGLGYGIEQDGESNASLWQTKKIYNSRMQFSGVGNRLLADSNLCTPSRMPRREI
jgi:hypothetical protein